MEYYQERQPAQQAQKSQGQSIDEIASSYRKMTPDQLDDAIKKVTIQEVKADRLGNTKQAQRCAELSREMRDFQHKKTSSPQHQNALKLKNEIDTLLASSTLVSISKNKPSEATRAGYSRKMDLMRAARSAPHKYCTERSLSKKTYQAMKAAFKHAAVDRLRDAADSGDAEKMQSAIQHAKKVISADGRTYEPKPDPTRERRLRESGSISKRRTLRGLPEDWREQIHARLCASQSKYADAALVMHLTGCRPSELVTGVAVKRESAGEITFYIAGSKQSDINQSGQKLRTLTYSVNSPAARAVEGMILAGRGAETIKLPSAKSAASFQKIYKEAAVKVLGKKGQRISPYSARHQFSADLKKQGYDKVMIAEAMGHQATASQSQYGTSKQGGGGNGPMVNASTQVRDTAKAPPTQSQSMSLR